MSQWFRPAVPGAIWSTTSKSGPRLIRGSDDANKGGPALVACSQPTRRGKSRRKNRRRAISLSNRTQSLRLPAKNGCSREIRKPIPVFGRRDDRKNGELGLEPGKCE